MLDTNQTGLITKKQMRLAEKVLGLIVDNKDNISGDESDNGELIDFEHFVGSILEQMEKPHWISAASREVNSVLHIFSLLSRFLILCHFLLFILSFSLYHFIPSGFRYFRQRW